MHITSPRVLGARHRPVLVLTFHLLCSVCGLLISPIQGCTGKAKQFLCLSRSDLILNVQSEYVQMVIFADGGEAVEWH